ncbi:acyltransferase [Nocardioides sp. InS609-2]|uniref:acyltransferase family protein n=1 Tax=Nocardioides sp. InS609-2 TaxID=2760705 RepID=UPI0020BD93EB|nr:acyltransferase [Nocardioides sp. InS609-2]
MTKHGKNRVQLAPEFPALDTMRAIGALAVLTTHAAFQSGDYLRYGVFGSLLSRLDIGVALFFVLSGFLLARPWLARAATRSAGPGLGRYYFKRVLRIYPVYVVTVVAAFTLIRVNHGRSFNDWVTTLLLGDPYVESRLNQGLTQMWSLSVEVAFYVVLPLVMWLAIGAGRELRTARILTLMAGLTALTVWWHLGLADVIAPHTSGNPMMWLPAFLVWFAVGIGFAWAHVLGQGSHNPPRMVRGLWSMGSMPGVCWVLAGGLMLVAASPIAGPTLLFVATPGQSLTKHLLYAVVAGLVVLPGIFAPVGSSYARALSWSPLRHVGHISYSIFCIHLPILYGVMSVTEYPLFGGHGLQIWTLTLALSLVVAEVLYRVVEMPFMRLKDLGRQRPPAAPPSRKPQTSTTR